MKITCTPKNNCFSYYSKQNISFEAGLTDKMLAEIQQTDVLAISNKLAKKGIPNDFQGNKIIAWGCDKTIQILQHLNTKFGQKLSLPKGIYVEDFKNLNVEDPLILGTCNLNRSELRRHSTEVVPSRTIFFNSIHNWNNINSISDNQYAAKHFSTDFFLYVFLHEFSHVVHEDRLLNKLGGKKLAKILKTLNEEEQLQAYKKKYGTKVEQICDYATNTPLDAIACDLPKVIAPCLDAETLIPTKNPFIGTPYERTYFWQKPQKHVGNKTSLSEILRNFWNGKFD